MKQRLLAAFNQHFGDHQEVIISQAPGRVNLIGEHTDYNHGLVLPITLDQAIYFALRKRNDQTCHLHSLNFQSSVTFELNHLQRDSSSHWADYVKGVLQILQNSGYSLQGIEGVIYGDIPIGAGLSSSAALEIATINALQYLFKLPLAPLTMIKLAQRAENEFVGMKCGIMDQFVSLLGKKAHALFIDCRDLTSEDVPFNLTQHTLLIVNSKIKHELVNSAYNERRQQCEAAVQYFHNLDPTITSLREVGPDLFAQFGNALPPILRQRCRHVIFENARVLQAVVCLKQNDMQQLGQLFYASHESLQHDYAVSCPEIDAIVEIARKNGALGARITGGGFGGCAIVLVNKKDAANLQNVLSLEYQAAFNRSLQIIALTKNKVSRIDTVI